MCNVRLAGPARLTIVRLFGIEIGALDFPDLRSRQISANNIFEASERLPLAVDGKQLGPRRAVESQATCYVVE